MSKNIHHAQNWSRNATNLEFNARQGNILVANTQPYGSATIDQVKNGVQYPNVQSALDDMPALFTLPINSIAINTDGISPAGVAQADTWTFSGIAASEGKAPGADMVVNTFGFSTIVKGGGTGDEVATKVKLTLDLAAQKGLAISQVTVGTSLDILQVRYSDYQDHKLVAMTSNGITITPATVTPAKPGYGVWTKIGTEQKTMDASVGVVTFYYFRRDN